MFVYELSGRGSETRCCHLNDPFLQMKLMLVSEAANVLLKFLQNSQEILVQEEYLF